VGFAHPLDHVFVINSVYASIMPSVRLSANVSRETMGKIALVAYATLKGMGWMARLAMQGVLSLKSLSVLK